MNKLLLPTLAACAALLCACSTELDSSGNPERAGAGEALVAVSLQFPQTDSPEGYADVPAGVALNAEKEVHSIAFIAFTAGGASVYLSTNPLFDADGFTKPLAPIEGEPEGNYTASFKIRSGDLSGTTTLVAVANFHEHGLTFDPKNFTIDKFKAMLTQALEADHSIEYPLLMTIAKDVTLVEGNTYPIAFEMERIMARVDVVNNAYDKAMPTNKFILTSARLLSIPTRGTMIAGQAIAEPTYVNSAVQKVVNTIDAIAGQPDKQQLDPLYTYENSNANADGTLAATATAVEIIGTYQGKAYQKIIPFVTQQKVVEGALTGGEIVPTVRNTRYIVEITAPHGNEVEFALKATDWTAGEQIDIKPDTGAPEVKMINEPGRGAKWNPATLTMDITECEKLSFDILVSGNREMKHEIITEYDENLTKLAGMLEVTPGKLSGYADEATGHLSRSYNVKISADNAFRGKEYPANVKIRLYNEKAETVVNVKYTPFFVTDLKSSQAAATIDPATGLVDLKNVTNGQTGTVSFFATSTSNFTTTLTNKGATASFYTETTADETDPATLAKYGPGKRVTVSYKALTDNPELVEVKVTDADGESAAKKVYVKCFKKVYFERVALPSNTSALSEGTDKLYLAVNNGNHGTIDYTVYDNVIKTPFTLAPTVTYITNLTSPKWATQSLSVTDGAVIETVSPEFQIVKRILKVSLPTAIKNPAEATSFKVGINGETPLNLIPVYLAGASINNNDKVFRPVLVQDIWWAPINVGQTMPLKPESEYSTDIGTIYPMSERHKACPAGWSMATNEEWMTLEPLFNNGGGYYNLITNSPIPNCQLKIAGFQGDRTNLYWSTVDFKAFNFQFTYPVGCYIAKVSSERSTCFIRCTQE